MSFKGFYRGKRVLVTGHTGFKGAWLSLWLKRLGAEVAGYALDPPTELNLYEIIRSHAFSSGADQRGDIRERVRLADFLKIVQPQIIFHLAAQPLVRRSYAEPLETLETNVLGTAYLLDSLRQLGLHCTVVVVTTDKCYENREWEFAYRENDPLGGHDIYSMSKAAAELTAAAWRRSFFSQHDRGVALATARAGNVIGGGDYAQDRIVPDCIRSLLNGAPISVRNPAATRPWQHVLECLAGYLSLAAQLDSAGAGSKLADAFNFGPGPAANRPVAELVEAILTIWAGKATFPALSGQPHEATQLNLAIDKANAFLDWRPVWNFSETVCETIQWYHQRHVVKATTLLDFSLAQIDTYTAAAQDRKLTWAIPS